MPTSRIQKLRDRAFQIGEQRNLDESRLLFHRCLAANPGVQIHNIKRAKAISYVLEHTTIEIGEDELLVGRIPTRPLTAAEKEELAEAEKLSRAAGALNGATGAGTGHRVVDFEKALKIGVKGILSEINELSARIDYSHLNDAERRFFYEACRISLEGLLRYADRYRSTLITLRDVEADSVRKEEYDRLIRIFSRIPYEPAQDFYEAIQCIWFLQVAFSLSDDQIQPGRPDHYLYPYYQQSIQDGALTPDFAMELIESFYIKTNEVFHLWPSSLSVGGEDPHGNPVNNELTRMFIDAIKTTGLINPSVAICYNENTPDDLLVRAAEAIAQGNGRPAIFNDAVIIDGLLRAGVKIEDARYYTHSTCVEITTIGCSNIHVSSPSINLSKPLEFILNEGREILKAPGSVANNLGHSGKSFDPGISLDPESLTTFESFYDAFKSVLRCILREAITKRIDSAYTTIKYGSNPLVSCFTNDCIAKGQDAACGGARHNFMYPDLLGFSTAVDSLAAIRQAVYEEGKISLTELRAAIIGNFEGCENLRQYLLNRCPKFCNDDESADSIAKDLYDFVEAELAGYATPLGSRFYPAYFAGWGGVKEKRGAQGVLGKLAAATPDGRRAGTAISECMGPVPGADRNGITAMARSISKLDLAKSIGGISTNVRFSREMLTSEEGKKAFVSFVREFMRGGGFQLQFNAVSAQDLLDAKSNPEQHRGLMVRIAGYCDYFVLLDKVVQDEIIRRTEYGSGRPKSP